MENRKLVEDRTAVDDSEFSDAATPDHNASPDKDPSPADTATQAGDSEPTQNSAPAAGNSTHTEPDTQRTGWSSGTTSSWSGSAARSTPSTPTPPAAPAAAYEDGEIEDHGGLLGTKVPISVALVMAVVLPAVGFFIGIVGSGKDSSSNTVNAIITPDNAGGVLTPGKAVRFTVLVPNPNDYGVQVTAIRAGRSQAGSDGCAEGAVTTAEVTTPTGYISPNGIRAYSAYATLAPSAAKSCASQTITVPLTVDLESAAG